MTKPQDQDINPSDSLPPVVDSDRPLSVDALFASTLAELRRQAAAMMRRERPSHTLQPTALVNEAYLRLYKAEGLKDLDRAHFLNIAAQAMRRILIEHARGKNATKRGGDWVPVTLHDIGVADFPDQTTIIDLDSALRRFAEIDERGAHVVELRIFTGLTMEEIAGILGVTRRTVQTDWRIAIMWLRRELSLSEKQ